MIERVKDRYIFGTSNNVVFTDFAKNRFHILFLVLIILESSAFFIQPNDFYFNNVLRMATFNHKSNGNLKTITCANIISIAYP